MPEYVYALHDFEPENEDEIPFRKGERIEVVEKDDLYGDGWWRGMNLEGDSGLFPVSYTTTTPSVTVPVPLASSTTPDAIDSGSRFTLQPLVEEPEVDTLANLPAMTDVQQAIEQLGRGPAGERDDQSFSFSSSKDEHTETEDDFDMSDLGGDHPDTTASWHKGARTKLAAKAKKAIEEAEKLEAIMNGAESNRKTMVPPVEVELSDDSDAEDGEYTTHPKRSSQPDDANKFGEDVGQTPNKNSALDNEADQQTPFPSRFSLPSSINSPASDRQHSQEFAMSRSLASSTQETVFRDTQIDHASLHEPPVALPSPLGSVPAAVITDASRLASLRSTYSVGSTSSVSPPLPSSSDNTFVETFAEEKDREKEKGEKLQAADWTVEEVVDWLRSRGFDQDVCDKFTEQEITGDVLVDLDVNLLKTEIGIMAFGKRMRIANAIADLRLPPSVIFSDHQLPPQQILPLSISPLTTHSRPHHTSLTPSQSASQVHSHTRSVSHSFSHRSVPSFGHISHRNSLGSPTSRFIFPLNGNGNGIHTNSIPNNGSVEYITGEALLPESELQKVLADGEFTSIVADRKASVSRLSRPSDSALKVSASVGQILEQEVPDRGHLSDSEGTSLRMRHRFFRRSDDSATMSRHSRDSSLQRRFTSPEKDASKDKKENHRLFSSSKSGSERLSIFGGSFSGTLGKSRKPAPKFPLGSAEDIVTERPSTSSKFSMSRLHSGSGKRIASSPGTPDGSVTSKKGLKNRKSAVPAILKESKDELNTATTFRNRTSSAPGPPSPPAFGIDSQIKGGVSSLKQGQSVLSQLGEPDHCGWMRKRGDKYSGHYWKLRYFVLKGQHLYWLRNDSATETKAKGYINIAGYKVTVDENINPGKYGFRIENEQQKTHYFSSDEQMVVRDWMKAIMKATIDRDYTKPVASSCNIPTITLAVAQAMNPAPRPPSPNAREAAQKALRRANPNQLSTRDARVLMGLPGNGDNCKEERARLESFFSPGTEFDPCLASPATTPRSTVPPPRPSRESRIVGGSLPVLQTPEEEALIQWANSHLPSSLQISIADPDASWLCGRGGLGLLRIAESIKGGPVSPPILDSAFPANAEDDKLDGLFRFFDFLLDNEIKVGGVSINDVRQGKKAKVLQLLRALKEWEGRRMANVLSEQSRVDASSQMSADQRRSSIVFHEDSKPLPTFVSIL